VGNKKIDDAKKYTYIAGNFNCHGDVVVQCGEDCSMEHILGFARSPWMPPSAWDVLPWQPPWLTVSNETQKH
jgi:hypothetical protein